MSRLRLSLIGYRGTGKTTVAQLLAKRLGWSGIDADDRLRRKAGKTIAKVFAEDGESYFRDLEGRLVEEILKEDRAVIAWGGGVILREGNRQRLCQNSYVVWLRAAVDTIAQRLDQDRHTATQRPPLTSLDERTEIQQLLEEREPFYEECADLTVDTDGLSPEEVAGEIWQEVERVNALNGIGHAE